LSERGSFNGRSTIRAPGPVNTHDKWRHFNHAICLESGELRQTKGRERVKSCGSSRPSQRAPSATSRPLCLRVFRTAVERKAVIPFSRITVISLEWLVAWRQHYRERVSRAAVLANSPLPAFPRNDAGLISSSCPSQVGAVGKTCCLGFTPLQARTFSELPASEPSITLHVRCAGVGARSQTDTTIVGGNLNGKS
jgi:hypothetical protein